MAATDEYTGVDVLEFLQDARKYNEFLVTTVRRQAQGKKRLLDFGAGIGTFAKSLRAANFDVTCVEPDRRMAARLQADGFATHASVPENERFELIYTLNVLEHIDDDAGILRAFKHSLAPGGKLYIYVPAFQSLYSAFDKRVGHVRRYHRSELVKKLATAGFICESARYVDSLGYFAAMAYRLIADDKGTVSPASVRIYDTWLFPLSRVLDRVLGGVVGKNLEIVAVPSA